MMIDTRNILMQAIVKPLLSMDDLMDNFFVMQIGLEQLLPYVAFCILVVLVYRYDKNRSLKFSLSFFAYQSSYFNHAWSKKNDQKAFNIFNREYNNEEELVFLLDAKGIFLYANEQTLDCFHRQIQELIGQSVFTIFEQMGIYERRWFQDIHDHKESHQVIKLIGYESEKWLLMRYRSHLDEFGNIKRIIATGNDVTAFMSSDTIKNFYNGQDQLTGIMNQYGMFEQIKQMSDAMSAICFVIQVQHLTEIINYYGHDVSNQLLKSIAETLKKEANPSCLIARYTESKFVIFCFNLAIDDHAISNYVSRLNRMLESSYPIGDIDLVIDQRIGYVIYPNDLKSIQEMVSLADIALSHAIRYHQKIVRFTEDMLTHLKHNVELSNKLKIALDEEKIEVHFQKAIDCQNSQVVILEELARWTDHDLGYISPLEFFRVARESNQLLRLDKYMIKKALKAYQLLKNKPEFDRVRLTLNISPESLLDLEMSHYLDEQVKQLKLEPKDICIEISEGTFINKLDLCISRIDHFKKMGYLIALDDFGVEYSSLAVLEKVDFDVIKIDAHFIKHIDNLSNQEIIKMIRRITDLSDKEMIAEGVETEEQSAKLRALGCHIQQGFYLHRPESLE